MNFKWKGDVAELKELMKAANRQQDQLRQLPAGAYHWEHLSIELEPPSTQESEAGKVSVDELALMPVNGVIH